MCCDTTRGDAPQALSQTIAVTPSPGVMKPLALLVRLGLGMNISGAGRDISQL